MDMSPSRYDLPGSWAGNRDLIERARITLVVSLSKRSPDELVRILMDWLDDKDLQAFCRAYLDESDLRWILGGTAGES